MFRLFFLWFASMACGLLGGTCVLAGPANLDSNSNWGPYNLTFLEGGIGYSRPLAANSPILKSSTSWSITGWLRPTLEQSGDVVIAMLGGTCSGASRCLLIHDRKLELRAGSAQITAPRPLNIATWQAIAVSCDGRSVQLFIDGESMGSASLGDAPNVEPILSFAPTDPGSSQHFGGTIAHFQLEASAAGPQRIRQLYRERPDFSLIAFQTVGAGWPLQERAWRGLQVPQDPATLPRASSPASPAIATPDAPTPALEGSSENSWKLGAWKLLEAPKVAVDGLHLSVPEFDTTGWYSAVVPGTVLTTLIARGVYPDPTYGLNNMAIPDSLSRQDYWYYTRFERPAGRAGRHFTLTFAGINYSAQVWLNGRRLGQMTGAFARGIFDVTADLRSQNALAVRVSPPPHPGIPHEESIAAGPGDNGGSMALDGPTFVAAEGWDWIPGIRDRNTGLWQGVELRATGDIEIADPHVVTNLPLPRTDQADISIEVSLQNHHETAVSAILEARFEGVTVRKSVTVAQGTSQVTLTQREFPQLRVHQPRLWWPNGYGSPELYHLTLSVTAGGTQSDTQTLRFGIRQLTYELSLFDHLGRLRRVEVDPTAGTARAQRLVDVRHEAIKKTPNGWAESLTLAGETSAAVHDVPTTSLAPYLVIRVNGVPIAARGGSWGMDDLLKRVSRERLEPYFRLHQAANLNIIRNWMGQNTEEVFYELADEYGLLVLNDFWASTQDYQLEPQDPQLFLANARDVLLRFRNHPSIALWFGRNEGVPQPILNEGLAELVASLDGTRHFTGSSNRVNLQDSGPYNYRPPEQYFTELARGFSVEVGTPSLSTLESLEASIPAADRWPISDTLAYHDWHFGGNGDVAGFMSALARQFGAPTDLADFERKAQMMNYVSYRAIFEGFQAHLWTQNSGRLLWMTHPSWPSNSWQIYSSDYDTHAAYYGLKSACEPVHAQMNLPDYSLAVVNTTREQRRNMRLSSRVLALDGRMLVRRSERVDAPPNSVTTLPALKLLPILSQEELVLVVLTLDAPDGARVSQNTYWQARDESSYRKLTSLAQQSLTAAARSYGQGAETRVVVKLDNPGAIAAVATKLTVVDDSAKRVLPVYYSDNYVTVLPHEQREISIRCPALERCSRIEIRGWNVRPITVNVGGD